MRAMLNPGRRGRSRVVLAATLLASLMVAPTVATAQHAGDVWIGRTADGQLAISTNGFVPAANYFELPPFSQGWLDDSPGFDKVAVDEPAGDVFRLESGAQVWLEVVSIDPAFQMVDNSSQFLDSPGDETYLGTASQLHVHNVWFVNQFDAAYDPEQCVWHATMVLTDKGSTGYATSAPLAFSFTNVELRYATNPIPDATFDFNDDTFVDELDYQAFAACLFGPGLRPAPYEPGVTTCEVECLNAFDADNDQDIDLADFALMQAEIGS